MFDTGWGEARVKVPGVCLSPSRLRSCSERIIKRGGWPSRSRSQGNPVAQELLYTPYFYFRYLNPRFRNQHYLYDVLIDGILGFSEFIRGSFELQEFSVPKRTLLERIISQEEAESRARKVVGSYAVRRQSLWVKEIKLELVESGEFYYPYWVNYLHTTKGIDIVALNGLTGNSAGPRPENILRAAIARDEWRREQA